MMTTAASTNTTTTNAPVDARQRKSPQQEVIVRLEMLSRDEGVLARTALDHETVESYAALMADGVEFPALTVFDDGEKLRLADGFHRAEAAVRAGLGDFACDVRRGTRRDAILHSIDANARHGLPRTDADKRRAVETLLRDHEWGRWSDREIARLAGVSKSLVGKLRRQVKPEAARAASVPRLARRGAQVYEMTPPPPRQQLRPPPGDGEAASAKAGQPNYIVNWLYFLVRFSPRQFIQWQKIVNGRTAVSVLAEAVDVVMRGVA